MLGYELWSLALAVVAGVACGFLNTVASSGSAVSLPALMAIGLDPITANATNRVPLLLGSVSATWKFHTRKALPWGLAIKVSIPTSIGAVVGARLIEMVPKRDVALIVTGAILLALVLLFTKVKEAIQHADERPLRFGPLQIALFFGIGVWLGFIVLDGATYLLLVLTLGVTAAVGGRGGRLKASSITRPRRAGARDRASAWAGERCRCSRSSAAWLGPLPRLKAVPDDTLRPLASSRWRNGWPWLRPLGQQRTACARAR